MDLTGKRFGKILVLKDSDKRQRGHILWLCLCDCGKIVEVRAEKLKGGTTVSCGCYAKEIHSEVARKLMTTHGLSYTSEYKRAANSKRRALKRAAKGSHAAQDIVNIRQEQDNKCFYCFKDLLDYHVDHKVPLSREGSDDKRNLCVACPTCNLRKNDRTHREFRKIIKAQGTE